MPARTISAFRFSYIPPPPYVLSVRTYVLQQFPL
nr:MAG TPA: hypothetical protein [Caudoviricetes sp.]